MPRIGVGVFVFRSASSNAFLLGKRLGSHGAGKANCLVNVIMGSDTKLLGTFALPGGHLEYGETFEQCAAREVEEETGLQLEGSSVNFITATNTVFPETHKHYVTIFMTAIAKPEAGGQEAIAKLMEPTKCEGWFWHTFTEMRKMPAGGAELFQPLHSLMDTRPDTCTLLEQLTSASGLPRARSQS